MAGFGVIINPHARGNRWNPRRLERFEAILGEDGEAVATKDLDNLHEVLRRFHADGREIIAICGGDGSFYHAVTAVIEIWGVDNTPLLLPLRGGTINNLARTIGARRKRPESMLAHVVKDFRQGRTHEVTVRDLIRVNGEAYGYIIGAGLIVNFLRLYYSTRKPGPASAFGLLVVLAFSNLFGTSLISGVVRRFEADVMVDGERIPFRSFSLFLASTVEHIGLGVKPFYLSARKRGYYHIIGGPSTPGELLRRLWRFFRGFPSGLDTLYDSMAKKTVVEFSEPQPYTINGDICDPVDVLVLEPGCRVRFVSG